MCLQTFTFFFTTKIKNINSFTLFNFFAVLIKLYSSCISIKKLTLSLIKQTATFSVFNVTEF